MNRILSRSPELASVGFVVFSWGWMIVEAFQARRWACCGPGATESQEAFSWVLMAVAMMLPAALRNVREVAFRSYRSMRLMTTLSYSLGFIGLWGVAGIVFMGFQFVAGDARGIFAFLLCLIAAALAFHPSRRRFFELCHRKVPLRPVGTGACVDSARQAAINASGCIGGCWPLMVACALMYHHAFMMIAGLGVVLLERRMFRFNPWPLALGSIVMALGCLAI